MSTTHSIAQQTFKMRSQKKIAKQIVNPPTPPKPLKVEGHRDVQVSAGSTKVKAVFCQVCSRNSLMPSPLRPPRR